ncbi:MAG: phosphoribosylformylglycinamidine synthase I [Anaerolineae bacterium]
MSGGAPRVVVVKADGTNCEIETAFGLELAGARPEIVPITTLRSRERRLADYDALVLPGGFSYGDDVSSGKMLAVELMSFLSDEIDAFIAAGKPVLGVCNGFQVLVRTGLLPFRETARPTITLATNLTGRYECRWVRLCAPVSSPLTEGLPAVLDLPVAHGEGRLLGDEATLDRLEEDGLAALRYADADGAPALRHPANPNGSARAIAAVVDPTGRILGLMPHPERFVFHHQHPDRRRQDRGEPHGLLILRRFVALA